MNIQDLIKFIAFTHQVQAVKRATMVPGEDAHENDAEHSFQLAITAWYLIEHRQLDLDVHKAIELALAHDLLEVFAGDTSAFAPQTHLDTKAAREAAAVKQLAETWPGFRSLQQIIAEYEDCSTPEAKFVYSLDKLLPIINNLLDDGRAWHDAHVTFEHMKSIKTGKIDRSDDIFSLYQELLPILEANPTLFVEPTKK
jgi:putative hydrolase of HD superfamily